MGKDGSIGMKGAMAMVQDPLADTGGGLGGDDDE
jgi:hypothetical protein